MTDDRVKKGWTGGIIDGILFRGALYNNAPNFTGTYISISNKNIYQVKWITMPLI